MAYAAAQCVVKTHRRLVEFIKPGVTLPQVDALVARTLEELGCHSAFLGYQVPDLPRFPSHACLSVNQCVVHGTAGYYPDALKHGDILKVDVGVFHRGWVGDAGWTYAVGGYPSEAAKRLMQVGKASLTRGIKQLRPGNTYGAWAHEVQTCVEREAGLHLIRGLGGHGYGKRLHEPPYISNVESTPFAPWREGAWPCEPGTLLAVEPMLAAGTTGATWQAKRKWPVFSKDGALTAHYEHDVLITKDGPRVLTEGMDDLPDVVG